MTCRSLLFKVCGLEMYTHEIIATSKAIHVHQTPKFPFAIPPTLLVTASLPPKSH